MHYYRLISFLAGFTLLWKHIRKWNSDVVKIILEKGTETDAEIEVIRTYNVRKERWDYDVYGTYKDQTETERKAKIITRVTVKNRLISHQEASGIFLSVPSSDDIESDIRNSFFQKKKTENEIKYPEHPFITKIRYYPEKITVPASKREEYFAILLPERQEIQ